MVFSRKDQIFFEDLANFFTAWIRFGLKISPHKCQFFKEHLTCMGPTFTLKDGEPSYTPIREKCDTIINLQLPNSAKYCRSYCRLVSSCYLFSKTSETTSALCMRYRKKAKFKLMKEYQIAFNNIKELLLTLLVFCMPTVTDRFRLESDISKCYVWQCWVYGYIL